MVLGTVNKLLDTSEHRAKQKTKKTSGNNGDMIIKEKKDGKKIAVANRDRSSPDDNRPHIND